MRGLKRFEPRFFYRDDETTFVRGTCPVTNKEWELVVPMEGCTAWAQGALIQNAFPNIPAHEREMLLSGTTQEGWDQLFGNEEDDA